MIDFKSMMLTSTQHRIPAPVVSFNSRGDTLTIISNWGEASLTTTLQKILQDAIETPKKEQSKKTKLERLTFGITKANDFLIQNVNKNILNTVVEITTIHFSANSLCWVNASSMVLYKRTSDHSPTQIINQSHLPKIQNYSMLSQETPLPFFGLGLQSSPEMDFGEVEWEPSSDLMLANFYQTPWSSTELNSSEPSVFLDMIAREFPNSAAWASSLKLKS